MSSNTHKFVSPPSLKLNALTNCAVMLLGIGVTFFLTPALLSHLGERRYGMWTLVTSLVGYCSLLQFGLTSSVFYYVPLFRGKGQLDKVNAVISGAMLFYLLVGIAVLALSAVLADDIAQFFDGGAELAALMRIVAVAFAVELPANIVNAAIKGFEGFVFVNIVTCITLLLRGGLLLGCVWAGLGLVPMGWMLVVVSCVSVLGQWVAFRRKCVGAEFGLRFVRWAEFRLLLIFGGVVLIANTANALAVESPKQIVGKVISLEALGVFSIPVLMIGYYRQVIFTMTRVLTPRFSYYSGQGLHAEIKALFLRSSRYIGIIASGIALLFLVAGPSFLIIWTHRPQMEVAIPSLLILIIGNLVLLAHRVSSDLLLGLGRQGLLAFFEMLEAAFIVPLVFILSKHNGIIGAALGIAIPFIIVRGFFQVPYVCKIIGVPILEYYRRCTLGPWLTAGGPALMGYYLGLVHVPKTWSSLFVISGFFIAVYGMLVYFLLLTKPERAQIREHLRELGKAMLGVREFFTCLSGRVS